MKLREFVIRTRDDLNRFHAHYERAAKRHPQLLADELPLEEWLALFVLFTEQETARPTRRG